MARSPKSEIAWRNAFIVDLPPSFGWFAGIVLGIYPQATELLKPLSSWFYSHLFGFDRARAPLLEHAIKPVTCLLCFLGGQDMAFVAVGVEEGCDACGNPDDDE